MLTYTGSSEDSPLRIEEIGEKGAKSYIPDSLYFREDKLPEDRIDLVKEIMEESLDEEPDFMDKDVLLEIVPNLSKSFVIISLDISDITGDKSEELEKYRKTFEELYNRLVPRYLLK
ncbi:hypothetical protein [Methanobacterium aggregans]|uniref:hypothetical protein n=1 Tax=Methanobacterium aggregans TaxID=1615586 RepID=UPI001AE32751|nr:hypothetical protein [Methanobacterium aggregans]MBP2045372.1 hypothetical protein [Methanobacterium aggregans]